MLAQVTIGLAEGTFTRGVAEVNAHHVALAEYVLANADRLPPDLHARTLAAYSFELFWADQQEKRAELCERALVIAREHGDPRVLAHVLYSSSAALDPTDLGLQARLIALTSEIIEVAAGIDDALVCGAFITRMTSHACWGDTEAAERDLAHAELLAERLRIPQLIARTKLLRASLVLLFGRLDDADVLLADYVAYSERENVANIAAGAGIRYRLQYERGDLADLEEPLLAVIAAQAAVPVWRMALCGSIPWRRVAPCRDAHPTVFGSDRAP